MSRVRLSRQTPRTSQTPRPARARERQRLIGASSSAWPSAMPQNNMCSGEDRGRPRPSCARRSRPPAAQVCRPWARASSADALDEAAEVRPLRRTHAAIGRDEQADRRIVEEIVAGELAIARRPVLARNADRVVELATRRGRGGCSTAPSDRADRPDIRRPRRAAVPSRCADAADAFSASSRSPASAWTRHGCRLPPEGARAARSRMSRTMCWGTGVGRNARQE